MAELNEAVKPRLASVYDRLGGLLVEQIGSDAYALPLKLPQFSYVVAKLRELSVMWAFGGSPSWRRERIEQAIAAVKVQVSDFIVLGSPK